MHNNIALDKYGVHGNFESSLYKPLLQWLQVHVLTWPSQFFCKETGQYSEIH